jgi:hypothetical protein
LKPVPGGARYLASVVALVAALLISLCCFNWLLDPFNIFSRSFSGAAVPVDRWPLNHYARIHKPLRLAEQPPARLILGTSRAGIGLPASGWPWKGSAYNLAIAGGNPAEIRALLGHALAVGRYESVSLTLDFPMSLKPQEAALPGVLLRTGDWKDSLRRILAPLTLLMSHKTLHAAWCGERGEEPAAAARIGPDGIELPRDKIARRERAASALDYSREQERRYAQLWQRTHNAPAKARAATRQSYFAELETLLKVLRSSGTATSILILPVHPWHLTVMREGGSWEHYRAWLGQVVALAENGSSIPVRDYSLVECAWTDAIPLDDRRWFVDPSHIAPEFGRELLAAELGVGTRVRCGVQAEELDRGNVDGFVGRLEERTIAYGTRFPGEHRAAVDLARASEGGLPWPEPSAACRVWERL